MKELVDFNEVNRATSKSQIVRSKYKIDRAIKILRCVATGMTDSEIAPILKLTPATCETYRMKLRLMFNAVNTAHMIKAAFDAGLLKPGETYVNGELVLPQIEPGYRFTKQDDTINEQAI